MSESPTIDKELLNDGDIQKEDEELIFNPYNSNNIEINEQLFSLTFLKFLLLF